MSAPSTLTRYAALLASVLGSALAPAVADEAPQCQDTTSHLEVEGDANVGIRSTDHAANAAKRFEMMDVDKNGRITGAEIDASHGAESIAWASERLSSSDKIRKLDSNSDGALTPAEYAAGSQKLFRKLDSNGDGNLSASEMQAAQ